MLQIRRVKKRCGFGKRCGYGAGAFRGCGCGFGAGKNFSARRGLRFYVSILERESPKAGRGVLKPPKIILNSDLLIHYLKNKPKKKLR